MAPTASFWDCGEFIACANELEVPHPPGAPFFLLVGRVFSIFAFGNALSVAFMMNMLSVLCATFTVLFTFWITTTLAKRLLTAEDNPSMSQTIAIMFSGLVGGLACTFADSFWFNAVEAEVYAMSSFFTAIVVWLMLKWERVADQPRNEKWIILIAYLMGLSIGVHLLNLLTIPALAFIYYFRKYSFSWAGFIVTGLLSVVILGVIQSGIIVYTFDIAWGFEKFFTGTESLRGLSQGGLGLPMGFGATFFFILLVGGLGFGVWYTHVKRKSVVLNTTLLSIVMIYIGLASYAMIPIRSNDNPSIDENNPSDVRTFLSYMKREQYGDRPLLVGPLYNARPIGYEPVGKEYVVEEGRNKYVEYGDRLKPEYSPKDMKVFPRMHDQSRYKTEAGGPHAYENYVQRTGDPNTPTDDMPTGGEDLKFFVGYQIIHMYWRYFMWNFAGRESDLQDAEWESGLKFAAMPDPVKNEPAKNHFFMIPFILGLLGLGWQASRRGYDATIVGLLFFFTGLAIIIYLNQNPNQPRERDYSFAGSFQTYAIWIGLSVIALYELTEKFLKGGAAYLAGGLALIGPLLMGFQGWDDHSRAGRYIAPDSAYNLLNSLAPNAILFTNGDNDTFPLWYIQEVENVRPDVRVLCLSYVNTDWYIEQMMMQMNESKPLPLSLKRSEYVGQENQAKYMKAEKYPVTLQANAAALVANGLVSEENAAYVQSPMKFEAPTRGGGQQRYLQLSDIVVLNLLDNISKSNWERPLYFANTVTPSSFVGLEPYFQQEGLAYRVLPVKRPDPKNDPFHQNFGRVQKDLMFDNLVNKFRYRNLNNPDVYYDENIRRMLGNYHRVFYRLSKSYLNDAVSAVVPQDSTATLAPEASGKAADARAKALKVMEAMEEKFPYTAVSPDYYYLVKDASVWFELGKVEKGDEYLKYVTENATATLEYYAKSGVYFPKKDFLLYSLQLAARVYEKNGMTDKAASVTQDLIRLQQLF